MQGQKRGPSPSSELPVGLGYNAVIHCSSCGHENRNGTKFCEGCVVSEVLTHYYRPFSEPLLSLSELSEDRRSIVLAGVAEHEPLPLRLTRPDYFEKRRWLEEAMRTRFLEKGGRPIRVHPHYFVLGEFSHWETDGSKKVQIPLSGVPEDCVSFTLTDSFFNYRGTNLRGVPIPTRPYHGTLFLREEMHDQLVAHRLPAEDWDSNPDRQFEVYVEAQLWSDEPVLSKLGARRCG